MKPILIYLAIVNLITFTLFAIDKWKAVHKKWRIKEFTLMLFGAMGGTVGGLLSMNIFRHKTQTPLFKFGMPLMLVLQVALAVYLKYKGII